MSCRLAILLAFLTACIVCHADLTPPVETAVSLPPPDGWSVQSDDGKVTLGNAEPGILTIDYDLKVQKKYTVGALSYNQSTSRLLLKRPIPFGSSDSRIFFECHGMERVLNREGKLQLMPLVQDSQGELFICEPFAYPHVKYGSTGWSLWATRHIYGGEAGGPTQNVYLTDGTGNGWPDGPLKFVGFDLQVRGKMGENLHGQFAVGDVSLAGMVISQRPPFMYADALLKDQKGRFTFSAESSTTFQGRAVYATQQTFTYDGESLQSRKQKLFLPTGPEGYFWANYLVRDDKGSALALDSLDYRVDPGVTHSGTHSVAPDAVSQTRMLSISSQGEVPGVVPPGQPFGVTVAINPMSAQGPLHLDWTLCPANYPNTLVSGQLDFPAEAGKKFIALPEFQGRDACCFKATLLSGGKRLDGAKFYVGRQTDFTKPYENRNGALRNRDQVKADVYFHTTFRFPDHPKSDEAVFEAFQIYLREATKMAREITITVDPAHLEMLPGVFDFALLDRMMDAASDAGAGVTLRFSHSDHDGFYLWPKLERQRNYDGMEIYLYYYGNYSPFDPTYIALWHRALRGAFDRYQKHPAFQGYYLMDSSGETVVLDQPWLGNASGYSGFARIAFREYLQKQMHWTLDQLNQRWSTHFASWDEVQPPLPDFSLRTKPDLRPQWLDFSEFKTYVDQIGWFRELSEYIRSYDPTHVIIAYVAQIEPFKDLIDYSHGGGVGSNPSHGEGETYWLNNRVGQIQESYDPHHWAAPEDPAGMGWALDWDLYTQYSRAGAGGMDLHIYYNDDKDIISKYGGLYAFDRFERFHPLMRELGQTVMNHASTEIAILHDPLTEYAKHRTSFSGRLTDLRRWFETLEHIGADYEPFRSEAASQYRLVLPNLLDEVMRQSSIDTVADYVRKGGHIVIAANTGRYNDVPGSAPYPLLRALQIDPPKGDYVTSGLDITATPTKTPHPLTEGLPPIGFYTLEKHHQEGRKAWDMISYKVWPYRWLSETDYFGYYPGQHPSSGTVLARFPDGGTAISVHKVGAGQAIVFWGTPDYQDKSLQEFMKRVLVWAKITDTDKLNPIPLMMEADNKRLGRHYAIIWNYKPGTFQQRLPHAPDGKFLLVDLVSDERLGVFDGATLRKDGLSIDYREGYSPLKVIRMQPDLPVWAAPAK